MMITIIPDNNGSSICGDIKSLFDYVKVIITRNKCPGECFIFARIDNFDSISFFTWHFLLLTLCHV